MSQKQSKPTRPHKNGRIPSRAIQAVVRKITEQFDPERVILFGSYAYGKPQPFSDVDLLVVLNTKERPRAKQVEIVRALSPHPFGMDILVRTPEQLKERIGLGDAFLSEITTKGKVLYERPRR
jgi:uncharacterized protein